MQVEMYSLIWCQQVGGPWPQITWVHCPTSVLSSLVWNSVSLYSAPECPLALLLGKEKPRGSLTSPTEKKGKGSLWFAALVPPARVAARREGSQGVRTVPCRDTICSCLCSGCETCYWGTLMAPPSCSWTWDCIL